LEPLAHSPLDLELGTARPFALTITAGASETSFELGGVPLTALTVRTGAAKVTIAFSAANPVEMGIFRLSVGAGAVQCHGLCNANFADMLVEGGAAGVQLYFDGLLRREGRVVITTALSGVELSIPADVSAEVTSSSWLGGSQADPGFECREGVYRTPAALSGSGPLLRIHNGSTLGGLRLGIAYPPALAPA
jgi:hypothetical protein